MTESDYTLITFPAGTVREARERDGQRAIPAWTSGKSDSSFEPVKPVYSLAIFKRVAQGSSLWTKLHVYSRFYRQGTPSFLPLTILIDWQRPVLIREHFRKCQHLTENHPLKVLCRLELEAHSRSSWGERAVKRKRMDLSASHPSQSLSFLTSRVGHHVEQSSQ